MVNFLIRSLLVVALVGCVAFAQAQDYRLAQQYFNNGEFQKAAVLYEKLLKETPTSDFYFERYLEALLAMEDFSTYERELKKRIREYPDKVQLYVNYGALYDRQFEKEKAEAQYKKAIDQLPANRNEIVRLANSFTQLAKYELALQTYDKGNRLLKDNRLFAYEMGDLYRRTGDRTAMVTCYLNSMADIPARINALKTIFQRFFNDDDYAELKTQLYERINADPDEEYFSELLSWVFVQQKDYKNALRQVKAMDRRLKENGGRVFQLAEVAATAKDYTTAIEAYEYIVTTKGANNTYYLDAKRESLKNKRLKIVEGYDYTAADLTSLEAEYEQFLDEFGRNTSTAHIAFEQAILEAFYLNNLDKAIALLESVRQFAGISPQLEAECKLSLGDFYLMKGEIWEATLLYSQVDKAFKEDLPGQTARFKNAKLSYYNGDFVWAQEQFSILKSATSRLLANDALDLSVFILDNMGLDSTTAPMELFAKADLLAFQNQHTRAFAVLDSVISIYPGHALEDDVLYTKAHIYLKQRDLPQTIATLKTIVEKYPTSIRTDNALFLLADLHETQLNDPATAQTYYSDIILNHDNSTFAVEARKRYRKLRGDEQ